jgi:heptosyltransferase-2
MTKIMIIKLGALGDVVRTLSILPAIQEKYPKSEIHWITKENALQLFEGNPYVKNVYSLPYNIDKGEKFDILYNFDIEDEATKLAKDIKADKKFGFYSESGFPAPFNLSAEYYLNTLFDDNLKKNNKKTYQEMMFEAAELDWKKQLCPIFLNEKDKNYAQDFVKRFNINTKELIGIHMGAGPRWPSKAWSQEKIKEFILMAKKGGYELILFGGPEESEKLDNLAKELKEEKIDGYRNIPKNTVKEFASLVNLCKAMVCSDTFPLHVSLALKKPTIGLFFCTSPDEIEDYGLLRKIVSPMLKDFFPEKMDKYDEKLVNSISAEQVLRVLKAIKL